MTEVVVNLSDELAERAKEAGLLTDEALENLLREELRKRAGQELRTVMGKLASDSTSPMSEDEIQAEIDAYRAARRGART